MKSIPTITPNDYPALLAAADAGIPEREQARWYGCAPSLLHRHLVKARRARELNGAEVEPESGPVVAPIDGSMPEILEARIRDPKTPARDLASLANALVRLIKDDPAPPDSPAFLFRPGTLILEPRRGPGSELRFRLMRRAPGRIEHVSGRDYDLTAAQALYLILCWLGSELGLTPDALGLNPEEIAGAAGVKERAT